MLFFAETWVQCCFGRYNAMYIKYSYVGTVNKIIKKTSKWTAIKRSGVGYELWGMEEATPIWALLLNKVMIGFNKYNNLTWMLYWDL